MWQSHVPDVYEREVQERVVGESGIVLGESRGREWWEIRRRKSEDRKGLTCRDANAAWCIPDAKAMATHRG